MDKLKELKPVIILCAFLVVTPVFILMYIKVFKHEKVMAELQNRHICTINMERIYNEIPAKLSLDKNKTQADVEKVAGYVSELLKSGVPRCEYIVIQGAIFGNPKLEDVTDEIIDSALHQ